LIARYRPALQVIESRPLSRESRENTLETVSTGKEEPAESCLFPGERDNSLATSRVFKMKHAWWTVAMLLSAAGATAYYFDIAHMRRRDADAEPQARLAKPEVSAASRPAAAAGPRAAAAQPAPAELAIKMKGDVRIAPASDAEDAGVQKISAPPAAPRSGEPSEKKWSVQIASMPERSAADSLAQDLSEKGYAAYVVTAEVKGRTYYRVRAGRFDARQDAESMRQELARQETYRESYVTND
jgi:cell division septation protein DedD